MPISTMLSRDVPGDHVCAFANLGDIVDDSAPLLHQPKIADRSAKGTMSRGIGR